MWIRFSGVCGVLSLLVLLGNGCNKPSDTAAGGATNAPAVPKTMGPAAGPTATPADTIARVHWLGKKRIAADTNAAHLMTIWNLPETARLGAQTLDKLALAPWRIRDGWNTNAPATNAASALLRPLLDDLVDQEWYLEARGPTNQLGELVLSIKLEEPRAALWQSNLANALHDLTGIRPLPAPSGKGWSLKKHDVPNLIELSRAGDWTLVGLAQNRNSLVGDTLARIQKNGTPITDASANGWLMADLDPKRLPAAFGMKLAVPDEVPTICFSANGDGTNVISKAKLQFSTPLSFEVAPWNPPTNLIHQPLASLTALQGFGKFLPSTGLWRELGLSTAPNQCFFWSQGSVPLTTYGAAPWAKATNAVATVTDRLIDQLNPFFLSNRIGHLERIPHGTGVLWPNAPFIKPFLRTETGPKGEELVYFGIAPGEPTPLPPPPETLRELLSETNVVLYDQEVTGARTEAWLPITQALRFAFYRAQLPPESASMAWLRASETNLWLAKTVLSKTAPNTLEGTRRSSVGLTSIELHLLADWLESPLFPLGLHTFAAPGRPLPSGQSHTKSPRAPASQQTGPTGIPRPTGN